MRTKPKVGQTLYSLNVGNAARRTEQKLTPVTVKKVGRKYFTCGEPKGSWRDTQYHLDGWYEKTDYLADSALYENPQELEDEKEIGRICKLIYHSFEYGHNRKGVPLEKLKVIEEILSDTE